MESLSFPAREESQLYSTRMLEVIGYRGQLVTNTFFRQDADTDHLAVIFPGLGYRCSGPLLHYATSVLTSLGADVLWVEYAYDKQPEYGKLEAQARKAWRLTDSKAGLQAALN